MQDVQSRSQQVALALLPRRLDALERIWREVFELERAGIVSPGKLDELISATLWVSEDLRESFLSVLLSDELDVSALRKLRTQLVQASAVTEIDAALRRLASTEEGSDK